MSGERGRRVVACCGLIVLEQLKTERQEFCSLPVRQRELRYRAPIPNFFARIASNR